MNAPRGRVVGIACGLIAAALLAGCEQAPPEGAVREALMTQLAQVLGKDAAQAHKADLDQVKVESCEGADPGGYRCKWSAPWGGSQARIARKGGSWVMVGVGGG